MPSSFQRSGRTIEPSGVCFIIDEARSHHGGSHEQALGRGVGDVAVRRGGLEVGSVEDVLSRGAARRPEVDGGRG